MKSLEAHDSILLDTHEGVKCFSLETVYNELKNNVPTLMKIRPFPYLVGNDTSLVQKGNWKLALLAFL